MSGRLQSPLSVDESTKTESDVLRQYYEETDYALSLSGILKITSVVANVAAAATFMGGGGCVAAPALVGGAPAVALAAAALAAALYAAALLQLPTRAPHLFLYADIILSTVMGVLVLMTGILSVTLCELTRPIEYVHAPLSAASACLVVGGAAATYAAATARLRPVAPPVPPPPPVEQDV
ncbi:uncharacterized protein ACR2FA_009308 [Aphomia sociella]